MVGGPMAGKLLVHYEPRYPVAERPRPASLGAPPKSSKMIVYQHIVGIRSGNFNMDFWVPDNINEKNPFEWALKQVFQVYEEYAGEA